MDVSDVQSEFTGYEHFEEILEKHLLSRAIPSFLTARHFMRSQADKFSDTGILTINGNPHRVKDVRKVERELLPMFLRKKQSKHTEGAGVTNAAIDRPRRIDIMRNHSATHLMHFCASAKYKASMCIRLAHW